MYKKSKYNYIIEEENNSYIYNFLHRSFLRISNETLNQIKVDEYSSISKDEIGLLMKYGIIINKEIEESYLMTDKVIKSLFNKKNMGLFLSMTSGCNFCCSYCYQDSRKDMDSFKYISKKNIDEIVRYYRELKPEKLSVVYFGGEPTLNIGRLIYAMESFDNMKETKINHTIICNGYLITNDLIKYVEGHNNSLVQITLDGNQKNHDKYRKLNDGSGTFNKIYENIKKLSEMIPGRVIVRINVNSEDNLIYYKLIDKICDDGINKNIILGFENVFDGQNEKHQVIGSYENIIELLEYAREKKCAIKPSFEFGPCLMHSQYNMCVDENKNTYSCPGQLYLNPIGKMENSKHNILKNEWYEGIYDRKECVKTCKYGPICYGGCILNGECRKDKIEELLPYIVKLKIADYKREKGNDRI
jgi:uncharacterized protein